METTKPLTGPYRATRLVSILHKYFVLSYCIGKTSFNAIKTHVSDSGMKLLGSSTMGYLERDTGGS